MSNAPENSDPGPDTDRKERISPGSYSNVEHTSESERNIQEDREKLSQSSFREPGSPRSGERDATSSSDSLAPGMAGKATP